MPVIIAATGIGFLVLAGAIHVLIFLLESVLWRSRSTWRGFGVRSAEDAEVIRPWALNQGFYNLFLAAGAIGGGIAGIVVAQFEPLTIYTPILEAMTSGEVLELLLKSLGAGSWIAIFCALCMVAAAIVLIVSSRGKLLRGALVQGAAPLVGLALIGIGIALAW